MKENFKCPKCKSMQRIGKRLHGYWICPKCHNTIIPNKERENFGYPIVRFKKSFKKPQNQFTN